MIHLENVSVAYPLMQFNSHSLRARISYRIKKSLGFPVPDPRNFIHGLRGLNLTIKEGEKVGVIGRNGAGKTTLLRTISGVYPPTSGHAVIEGKVSSLIDTTLGMDAECSGVKNIIFRLIYNGKTFSQAASAIKDISQVADLGDAIYDPLYTYSTGMWLRLAFAIATHETPEILIMDEIIGAGDEKFRTVALAKMDALIGQSRICVISSHDLAAIKKYCTRCLLLSKGRIEADGDVEEVTETYLRLSSDPEA